MNKKNLVGIIIILIISILGAFLFMWFNNPEELSSYYVQNILKPYLRIEKNEELSSTNLTLNESNNEIYYYFNIYNYDKDTEEYSSTEVTPYVKINLSDDNKNPDCVTLNLYYLKDESLGFLDENILEITDKGKVGSGYEEYYKCKNIKKYDEENLNENVSHYVAKITLNTDDESYNNLTQNLSEKIEIILGYRK